MAHMHYKGTGKVHSFRGLLTNVDGGNQHKIRIQGPVGAIAWRITKFQVMQTEPGQVTVEHTLKIYREEQTTIDNAVNFADNELLGMAYYTTSQYPESSSGGYNTVIFDNALFVRNIWVTHEDTAGSSESANYYIELEEVKVSAAGMAQLAVAAARRLEEK